MKSQTAIALLALTGAALPGISSGGVNFWTPSDTGAGRVTSIVVEACRPTTIYALALDGPGPGGLYRSTDGGNTWNGFNQPRVESCGWPGNVALSGCPATALVASCDGHVYRTSEDTDVLVHSEEGLPLPARAKIAVDAVDPSITIAGTGNGFWRSFDGGQSWFPGWRNPYRFFSASLILPDPGQSGVFYAVFLYQAVFPFEGLFRTTDGGETWSFVTGAECAAIALSNPLVLFAGLGALVHRSIDGGMTWNYFSVPGATSVSTLAVDPTNPDIVLAATDAGLQRSLDGGEHWSEFGNGLESETVTALAFDPGGSRTYAGTETGHIYQIDVLPGAIPVSPSPPALTVGR